MARPQNIGAPLASSGKGTFLAVNPRAAAPQDLGPLAWVLEDLCISLNSGCNAIRRFIWDEKTGVRDPLAPTDTGELRQACLKFHRSAGALEMVGQQQAAAVLRAMETLAHKFVQWPAVCTDDAALRVEHASRAVVDYVEGLLKGSQASPVAFFPQQRAVVELCGAERIHPADLWQHDWQLRQVDLPAALKPLHYSPALRASLGATLLPILKTLDAAHATQMARLCAGLAAGESSFEARIYWAFAAGFFEAIALAGLPDDVYVRRSAAKIMAQYALLATGQGASLEVAVQDLMFFCALARPPADADAPVLQAVRSVYGLDVHQGIDYEASAFGRFDPAQISIVRKRIGAAAESWSALAGGDLGRFGAVAEQFAQIGEAIVKLHSDNLALLAALSAAAQAVARTDAAPSPPIAMEVATALLYLEAAYEDMDFASPTMEQRSARLASRLQQVCTGGAPEPIENWMEDLYRRVSDRKTMGSVVMELRLSLAEVEKSLDRYFRGTDEPLALQAVPVVLGQMRGVFSVLGLDQAALAALRMRANVERLLASVAGPQQSTKTLSLQLVSSLSAMGFLIDMLAYQPAMAKELFVFDEALGEFKPRMGRVGSPAQGAHRPDLQAPETVAQEAPCALLPKTPGSSPQPTHGVHFPEATNSAALAADTADLRPSKVADEGGEEEEIRAIFLAEAREVLHGALQALDALALAPDNFPALATLRRAFHTLKGSARMVDLLDLGEAAWAFEQLLNASLAEQQPASHALLALCKDAVPALGQWIDALTLDQTPPVAAADFRRCADSLRLHQDYEPLPRMAPAQHAAEIDAELSVELNVELNVEFGAPQVSAPPAAADTQTPQHDPDPMASVQPQAASIYQAAVDSISGQQALAPPDVVVGHLRLNAEFFAVFMAEAQSWAQRLQAELVQWDIPSLQALPHGAADLAHSLQGSAAAVGFTGLWELARALEQALTHLAIHGVCSDLYKSVLCDAAHETTRLLAGFSIGTLAAPSPAVMQSLANLVHARVVPLQRDDPLEGEASAEPQARATDAPVNLPLQPTPLPTPDSPVAVALPMPDNAPVAPSGLARPSASAQVPASVWSPDFEAEDALDAE